MSEFDVLIGTWRTEATHPQFEGVVRGEITYEWLGTFLIERGRTEHDLFPDSISVIGGREDGDGLVAEYFDQRGVRRTYEVSFQDGVLRKWRDHPTFAQRFEARPSAEEFVGLWQLAETPGDWRDDLEVIYRR
jgi:hypothetical protein